MEKQASCCCCCSGDGFGVFALAALAASSVHTGASAALCQVSPTMTRASVEVPRGRLSDADDKISSNVRALRACGFISSSWREVIGAPTPSSSGAAGSLRERIAW